MCIVSMFKKPVMFQLFCISEYKMRHVWAIYWAGLDVKPVFASWWVTKAFGQCTTDFRQAYDRLHTHDLLSKQPLCAVHNMPVNIYT
jgi:hypothetical protein